MLVGQQENDQKDDKMVTANIDLKLLGGQKRLALNAAAFELKLVSLQCINTILEKLNTHFNQNQYINDTLQIVLPLIDMKQSREVRQNAMEVAGNLVLCVDNQQHQCTIIQ